MIFRLIVQTVLWFWALGCVTTYRIRGRLLAEGRGLKSAEFVTLCLYSAALVCFYRIPTAGKWILLIVLAAWFVLQFFRHWYYTVFGADRRKLRGYNDRFRNTIRLFPASETRLVPDLYHIVLHLLILLNLVCCLF